MVQLAAIALAATASATPLQAHEPEPIAWRASYREGLEEAHKAKVPVLLYFAADWCEPCRHMEATTLRDPEFMASLIGLVPVKSLFFAGSGLAKKFNVFGVPEMILVDEDGEPITSWIGYHSPERLVPELQAARAGYAAYRIGMTAPTSFSDYRRVASYLVNVGNTGRALAVLETGRKQIPKSDRAERERADLDIAEAHEIHGELGRAAELYTVLSMKADEREVRARALHRLSRVEQSRGRPKEAVEAKEKLARLYPDLDPAPETGPAPALREN